MDADFDMSEATEDHVSSTTAGPGSLNVAGYWEAAAALRLAYFDNTPIPSDALVVEQRKRGLREEILALERVTASFWAHVNALAPVSRIPPEILARVFKLAFDTVFFDGSPGEVRAAHIRRIKVTHMCQRWRNIALGTPDLWEDVDFALGREWAEKSFAWARTVPVSIHLRPEPLQTWQCQLALMHVPHARRLRITHPWVWPDAPPDALCGKLSVPAPLLEDLTVVMQNGHWPSYERPPPLALPADLFGGVAPYLRRIELGNVEHSLWASSIMKHVVDLTIVFRGEIIPPPPSLDVFLDALTQMTVLEELQLRSCLPVTSNRAANPAVNLPHLTKLTLKDWVPACTFFMQHVHFPSTAKKDMYTVSSAGDDMGGIAAFLHELGTHFGTSHARFPSARISLDVDECDGLAQRVLRIGMWYHDLSASNPEGSFLPADLDLTFGLEFGSPIPYLDVVRGVLAALTGDMLSLRYLDVFANEGEDWGYRGWLSLLGARNGVATICIGGVSVTSLCHALAMSATVDVDTEWELAGPGAPEPRIFFCSELSSLTLFQTRYYGRCREVLSLAEPRGQMLARRLKDRWLGPTASLENLRINSYGVDLGLEDQLREVVLHLHTLSGDVQEDGPQASA